MGFRRRVSAAVRCMRCQLPPRTTATGTAIRSVCCSRQTSSRCARYAGPKKVHCMIAQKRYYGKGRIDYFSPPTLQTGAKMVNCYVNFVELLQIKAAIDEAVIRMNRNKGS